MLIILKDHDINSREKLDFCKFVKMNAREKSFIPRIFLLFIKVVQIFVAKMNTNYEDC